MCDEHSMTDMADAQLSRRRLGALTIGAGLMAALPRAANAVDVKESTVTIKTPDGKAEAHFVHPSAGKAPAVLVWPDAFGLRPAFTQMGKRLAESGYAVLTVNPYYRTAKVPALPAGLDFAKPDDRAQIMKLMSTLSPATHVTDAKAFIGWLDSQSAVDTGKKMGTTGYCMGGPITMRTAAERPDRVGGAASFHGGGLVTDQPNSPHLLVSKIKAQYLFAVAQNDDQQQPTAKDVLRDEFAKNKLKAEIEVYPAQHGWCPPDAAVYDQAQAEKAWSRMLATFKTALV
ncbi:MAG: dienelactone hydrolase family protein [Proteobacteria bacterium]|nr:dienelactone hydrolase family protein [Pseudomonadota bacterium]